MTLNNETIPILGEIETILAGITPEAISRVASKLSEIREGHDKVMGVIHREEIKRLFVAGRKLDSEAKSLLAKADIADTEQEGKEMAAQAAKLKSLSSLCLHLCAVQVRDDFNMHDEQPGIKAGWMVTTCGCAKPDDDEPPPEILEILNQIFRPRR